MKFFLAPFDVPFACSQYIQISMQYIPKDLFFWNFIIARSANLSIRIWGMQGALETILSTQLDDSV